MRGHEGRGWRGMSRRFSDASEAARGREQRGEGQSRRLGYGFEAGICAPNWGGRFTRDVLSWARVPARWLHPAWCRRPDMRSVQVEPRSRWPRSDRLRPGSSRPGWLLSGPRPSGRRLSALAQLRLVAGQVGVRQVGPFQVGPSEVGRAQVGVEQAGLHPGWPLPSLMPLPGWRSIRLALDRLAPSRLAALRLSVGQVRGLQVLVLQVGFT